MNRGELVFRLIVEAAPQAMLVVDRDGQISLVNRAADQLFGYPGGELIGQPVTALVPERLRQRYAERAGSVAGDPACAAGDPACAAGATRQLIGKRRDGGEIPVEVTVTEVAAPDGVLTLISIVDAAEHLAIEQKQREMAAVVDSADDAIITMNLDGIVRSFNPGAARMLGYRADEIIGQPVAALLPADRIEEEREILEQVRGGDRVSHLQTVRQRKDGSLLDVSLSISPIRDRSSEIIGASKIMRDITEHKRAQEMFRLVVEMAPNALVVADQHRIITLVNRKTEDLFGYTRAELIGQPVELLVPPAFRTAHVAHHAAYLTAPITRAMGSGREVLGRRKDGSELPLEIGLTSLDTSQGLYTLASIIDITDRKQFEDELRRSNAELEQFAYIASHDLQEPLRMVASYTELLGQRYKGKLDEKADKYIYYAVDGAKRMQHLVSDLLAYSRVGSQGKPMVPVDTQSVVTSVVEMLRPAIRKANANVEVSQLPAVLADEVQLRQLFQNLIGNALKFRADADPVIGVRAARHGERWLFCVEDNGIGIDMQYAARVFQMFQRLHERGKYEGSGIGLAISKRIVERHGGTIWLESKPGLGTSFFFSLPPIGAKPPS